MEDMSNDEVIAFFFAVLIAAVVLMRWYWPLSSVTELGAPVWHRLVLMLLPPMAQIPLWWVLRNAAAHEVDEGPQYVWLFMTAGGAWVGAGVLSLRIAGIEYREDAIERHNPAAVAATCGAVIGLLLCFAGANAGEGDTIWTTFVPALLGTLLLLALWLAVECVTHVHEAIVVGRDTASGLRLAGLLVGCGVVLGWAAAGDWNGGADMVADFARRGWPALLIAAMAIMLQRTLHPAPRRPLPPVITCGLIPAALLVLLAVSSLPLTPPVRLSKLHDHPHSHKSHAADGLSGTEEVAP